LNESNMKKLAFMFLLAVFSIASCFAATISKENIIPKFYVLLIQETKPSVTDERDFFGGDECADVRSRLLAKKKIVSETPIWDYLREHRELFITKNIQKKEQFIANYSSVFQKRRMNLCKETSQMSDPEVLVTFPTKRDKGSSYSGESSVIFTLGKKCYLDIGASIISGNSKIFNEILFYDTGGWM